MLVKCDAARMYPMRRIKPGTEDSLTPATSLYWEGNAYPEKGGSFGRLSCLCLISTRRNCLS